MNDETSNPQNDSESPTETVISRLQAAAIYLLGSLSITKDHVINLWSILTGKFRYRSLQKSIRIAEADVGEQLAKAGLGDQQLVEQLNAMDERIKNLKSADASPKQLLIERLGILRRIHNSAKDQFCEETPSAVARARRSLEDLTTAQNVESQRGKEATDRIVSHNSNSWRQLFIGYTACFATVYLAWTIFLPFVLGGPDVAITGIDDTRIVQSVGFVVSGIRVTTADGEVDEVANSTGTCFAVTPDGYLLTNRHVTESYENLQRADALRQKLLEEKLIDVSPQLWVFFDGQQYAAQILYSDTKMDLAILKIDCKARPYLRLAKAVSQRGTDVYALGFPGAGSDPISESEMIRKAGQAEQYLKIRDRFRSDEFELTMTKGIVSRVVNRDEIDWIQHNADINPGNSGGPLVSADGTVSGINTLRALDAQGVFYSFTTGQLEDLLNAKGVNAKVE